MKYRKNKKKTVRNRVVLFVMMVKVFCFRFHALLCEFTARGYF